ncbi:MAG TPA: hypothetical protein VFH58_17575 [Acidimicrobiales bacterium]|nr:hypothetical protein [Acidimicrobiales bacterium]
MAGLGGGEPGPDELLADLARWAAAERVTRAASERARTRDLIAQSTATATWAGLLVDLAEAAAEVTLWLEGGRKLTGRLVGTGRDFAVVERRGGRAALVRTGAISALAPAGEAHDPGRPGGAAGWHVGAGGRRAGGSRPPGVDLSLAAALDGLAAEGYPVSLHSGAETVTGVLVACGEDVVTLRADGAQRRPVYVPLGRVSCVELR